MKIDIKAGDKTYQLRGGDRCIELCEQHNIKNKDTGKITSEWVPFKYYPTLLGAMNALLEMKIRASDADSLADLQVAIKRAADELKGLYELNIT